MRTIFFRTFKRLGIIRNIVKVPRADSGGVLVLSTYGGRRGAGGYLPPHTMLKNCQGFSRELSRDSVSYMQHATTHGRYKKTPDNAGALYGASP